MTDPQERALVWLAASGFDHRECALLLRAAGSPKRLYDEFEKILPTVIQREDCGVYKSDRSCRERELNALLAEMEEKEYFAVTLLSDDYPKELKAIPAPPIVLFGKGNHALLKQRKFALVGSRLTPPWAESKGKEVAKRLSRSFVIVTGIAEGGDSAAIEGAYPSGNLIAVLPCGLNECYPAAHAALKEKIAKKGLLLTEYPPKEKLRKYYFHARNRILAGLAEGVLVISAGVKSGALITANRALEYGREVYAFPYSLGASQGAGCNELIKSGAYLATGAEDILSDFGISVAPEEEAELDEGERRVLTVLREKGETHLTVIAQEAGLPVFEAMAVLSALEIKNLAVKAGGNRYAAL